MVKENSESGGSIRTSLERLVVVWKVMPAAYNNQKAKSIKQVLDSVIFILINICRLLFNV